MTFHFISILDLHSTNDMLLMSLQQLSELKHNNVPSGIDIQNTSKMLLQNNDLHNSPYNKISWNEATKEKWNLQKDLECRKQQHVTYNNFNSNMSSPNIMNAKVNDNKSPITTPTFNMTQQSILQNGNNFQHSPSLNPLYNLRPTVKANNINSNNIWSPYNNVKTPLMKPSNIINESSNRNINSPNSNNISIESLNMHNSKNLTHVKKFNLDNTSNDFSPQCYVNQIQQNEALEDNTNWRNIEPSSFNYSLKIPQSQANNMFSKITENKNNYDGPLLSQFSQKDTFNNNDLINSTLPNYISTMNNLKKTSNVSSNIGGLRQGQNINILHNDHTNDLADVDKEFEQILSSVARKESTSSDNSNQYNNFPTLTVSKNQDLQSNTTTKMNKQKVPLDLPFLAPLPLNNTVVLTEYAPSSSLKNTNGKLGFSTTINFTPPGSPTLIDKNDSFNSFFVPFHGTTTNNFPSCTVNNLTPVPSITHTISEKATEPSSLANQKNNKTKNKDIKGNIKKSSTPRNKKTKEIENEEIKLLDKEKKEKEEEDFLNSLLFMPNANARNNSNIVPIYKQKSKPCYAEASLTKEDILKPKNAIDEYDFIDDEPEEILPKTVTSGEEDSEEENGSTSSKNKSQSDDKNHNTNDNETSHQKSRKNMDKNIINNKDKVSSNGVSLLKILKERKLNDQKVLTNNELLKHEICFKEHNIKTDQNCNNEIKTEIDNENKNEEIGDNSNKKKCIPPLKILSMLPASKKSPSVDENIMPAIPKLRIKIFKQEKSDSVEGNYDGKKKKKKKRKLEKDEDYMCESKGSKKKKRKKHNDDDSQSNESTNYKAQIIMFEEHGYIEFGSKNSLTVEEWNMRSKQNYSRITGNKTDKCNNILMKVRHIAPNTFIGERLKMFGEASESVGKGTFLIHKSDLSKEDIPLWKVDSQNLLQKFPAFKDSKSKTYMYKSSSTYSGWCDQLINEYMIINVNVVKQSRSECIVELPLPINDLFPVMTTIDVNDVNIFKDGKASKDNSNEEKSLILSKDDKVVENMIIYIEALLNHAISSTFLDKVKQGNDWNFLLAINEIDRINNEAKERVKQRVKWTEKLETTINDFLYCSIIDDVIFSIKKDNKPQGSTVQCQACGMKCSEKIIQFFQKCDYDRETLEIKEGKKNNNIDDIELSAMDFHICEICADLSEIYHRLTHMRFLTFMNCEEKLEELCMFDENIMVSKAISVCLKDVKWLNTIMSDYCDIWKRIQRNDI
uniref:DUF4211 domain-containing protein n=1 Tax=Parastrongyloides trichosuri TaxID=131310 RepID=A0A0N4Z378_PARTI